MEKIEALKPAKSKPAKSKPADKAKENGNGDNGAPPAGGQSPEPEPEVRVSTTDAAACVMKMADGGFRPAFNAQLAVDTGIPPGTGLPMGVTRSGRRSITSRSRVRNP